MNKKQLAGEIANKTGMSQSQSVDVVDAFTGTIVEELKQGHDVNIPGFGKFVAKHRPSREMRNPATGKTMMSKAKTSAQFKPALGLKDL